jgi:predicted RNA-binding Zn-ribbon protein involved in translation (DUF1610 family)
MTSAGRDSGMLALTDTYYCDSCDEIVDVLIGHSGMVTSDNSHKKYKKCPKCGKTVHFKWDTIAKPCPKCKDKMEIDPKGRYVRWD